MPPPAPAVSPPHGPAAAAAAAALLPALQLLDLPDELVLLVASFLSGRDAVQLGRTCRRLQYAPPLARPPPPPNPPPN